MCPLRYIVFFISACIAVAVLLWQNQETQQSFLRADGNEDSIKVARTRKDRLGINSYFDLINGRYIYNTYKTWKSQQKPLHENRMGDAQIDGKSIKVE